MQYRTGGFGRVIVAKAEHGDDLLQEIREILSQEKIQSAWLMIIGALQEASLVVGPETCSIPPQPVWRRFDDGREIIGMGTAFGEMGEPLVHLHASLGRGDEVLTGCIRQGTRVYLVVEIIIMEILGVDAVRAFDNDTMLHLLSFL
ncbi:MAG: PPC domain-containing DNA-binding protein [Methylocystaceae bacterium]